MTRCEGGRIDLPGKGTSVKRGEKGEVAEHRPLMAGMLALKGVKAPPHMVMSTGMKGYSE